jgi:hypothetical protein
MPKQRADLLTVKPRSTREKQSITTKIAYKKVFGSDDGRAVLLDLMKSTNMFTTTYPSGAADPVNEMLLAEGARMLVNRILTEIHMDLEEFLKCFEEAEEMSIYEDEK